MNLVPLYLATLGRIELLRKEPALAVGVLFSVATAVAQAAVGGHLTWAAALPAAAGALVRFFVSPATSPAPSDQALKELLMSAIDDLNAAVARVESEVTAAVQRVNDLAAKAASGVDPAAVEASVVALNATADQVAAVAPVPVPPA